MNKRGILSIFIVLGVIILASGFGSAFSRADAYVDCKNRGGWIYEAGVNGVPAGLGSATYSGFYYYKDICTIMGMGCIVGYQHEGTGWADIRSCTKSDGYSVTRAACCSSVASSLKGADSMKISSRIAESCPSESKAINSVTSCHCPYTWSCTCTTTFQCTNSSKVDCPYIGDRQCTGATSGSVYKPRRQCTMTVDGDPYITSSAYSSYPWFAFYTSGLPSNMNLISGAGGDSARWVELTPCKTTEYCFRGDCCVIDNNLWGPSESTICSGVSFDQESNCGTTRTRTGSKASTTWTPLPEAKCTGTKFVQTGLQCGEQRLLDGTMISTTWEPSNVTICNGTKFNQTGTECGEKRERIGINLTGSCCADTIWTPLLEDYCTSESVTQTSNCGRTRTLAGTKNCCDIDSAAWGKITALIGTKTNMTAISSNCTESELVNFTIYRYTALGVDEIVTSVLYNMTSNSSVQNITLPLITGQFYFNVTLLSNKSITTKSPLLTATSPTSSCGNGSIDYGEDCDYAATPKFRAEKDNCTEVNTQFTGGTLNCSTACTFETSKCTAITVPSSCSSYDNEVGCEAYSQSAATGDEGCEPGMICGCLWDSATNSCGFTYNKTIGSCNYRCLLENKGETACENGIKEVQLSATMITISGNCAGITDPNCVARSSTVPCGLFVEEMPLFGWFNFVITVGIVIAVYGFMRKK